MTSDEKIIVKILVGLSLFTLASLSGFPVRNADIFYRLDTRTGYCFAYSGRNDSQTLAHVPCTPTVMGLIK